MGTGIKTISAIAKPSLFFVGFCGNGLWHPYTGFNIGSTRPQFIHRGGSVSEVQGGAGGKYLFTKGRVNVVFADGHVEALQYTATNTGGDKTLPLIAGGSSDARYQAGWLGR